MKNKIYDAFDKIKADDSLKRNTENFISKKISNKSKFHRRLMLKRVLAFACVLLILLGIGGYKTYYTEASTISIDINPSIEIGLNYFDRVISVKGFGEDAGNIVKNIDIKNKKYLDAINSLMKAECLQRFVSEKCTIMFTVVTDKNKEERMVNNIKGGLHYKKESIVCYLGNKQYVEQAHVEGLSVGKYRAYLQLSKLNSEITIDDIRNLSMREIQAMINSYSKK